MVTFTINIPPMLVYIPAPWILWDGSNLQVTQKSRDFSGPSFDARWTPLGLRASPGLISYSVGDDPPATLMLYLLGSTRRFFSDAATWNEEIPSFGHLKKWGLSVAPCGFLCLVVSFILVWATRNWRVYLTSANFGHIATHIADSARWVDLFNNPVFFP